MKEMKVIDLLNMIANGEIDESTIIEFDNGYNDYCSVRVFFDRYIMDKENLNLKIKLKENNNKIKKICTFLGLEDDDYAYEDGDRPNNVLIHNPIEQLFIKKINEIIDKLNNMEE